MNIYFIDPTYILDEAWSPLFNYLKIKSVWRFIQEAELSASIIESSKNIVKGMYTGQDMVSFVKNCSYWLAGHIAKHMPINSDETDEVTNKGNIYQNARPSSSALYNINHLDENNCLILISLTTDYDEEGTISKPHNYNYALKPSNVPTNIAKSSLSILNYRCGHDLYRERCAFVMFDKYMSKSYYYSKWWYILSFDKNGDTMLFTKIIKNNMHKIAPKSFPLISSGNGKSLSSIITNRGEEEYHSLLERAERQYEKHREWEESREDAEAWKQEMKEAECFALGGRSYDQFTMYR